MTTAEPGRGSWERHAGNYDRSMRVLGGPLPRMLELTVRAVRGSERVLEVAAGTGLVVAPTFCHDETFGSRMLSRLLAVTGFPGARRFRARSLGEALRAAGFLPGGEETIPGVIPIGFVEARTAGG